MDGISDIMYEIPSISGKKRVIVNRDVVEKSQRPEVLLLQKSA
jgi:ATP-dependent protease Clp ATPase subunit